MHVQGKIISIGAIQTPTPAYTKRDFVVMIGEESPFPQPILFQLSQEKCFILEGVKEGDAIAVHFNLRGRQWVSPQNETKYFNTLECWKIEKVTTQRVITAIATEYTPPENAPQQEAPSNGDVPF